MSRFSTGARFSGFTEVFAGRGEGLFSSDEEELAESAPVCSVLKSAKSVKRRKRRLSMKIECECKQRSMMSRSKLFQSGVVMG